MFFKNCVFFFPKFGEPLPISIDPFCFSIDRNFLIMLERVSVCFDRSKLFFNCSKYFQIVLIESLSVLIDRGCFFDRSKLVKHVFFFKRSECLFQKVLFQKFSTLPLSPTWLRLHQRFFVVFLWNFCKVFVFQSQ